MIFMYVNTFTKWQGHNQLASGFLLFFSGFGHFSNPAFEL